MKIMTVKGRIFTLEIIEYSATSIEGTDKFGKHVILPKDDVKSLIPLDGDN